jgi:opacity protein-like surface antigen
VSNYLAYGGSDDGTVTVNGAGAFPNVVFNSNNNNGGVRVGWTLGGGLEYALTNNVTAKVEYLHVDFGNYSSLFTGAGGLLNYTLNQRNNDDIIRVGLNYVFH